MLVVEVEEVGGAASAVACQKAETAGNECTTKFWRDSDHEARIRPMSPVEGRGEERRGEERRIAAKRPKICICTGTKSLSALPYHR